MDENDKATQIILAVRERVKTVDILATVVIGRPEHLNVDRPAVGIFPVLDDEIRASKLHRTSELDIVLRLLVDEADAEAGIELMMAVFAVKQAMRNDGDRTWGGLATDYFPGATKYLYVDSELPRAGADIEYKFNYQLAPLPSGS